MNSEYKLEIFRKDGKVGAIRIHKVHSAKDTILPAIYDLIVVDYQQRFKLIKDNKYGFADHNGDIIIDLEYDEANNFLMHDVTFIKKSADWILVNTNGKKISKQTFDSATHFDSLGYSIVSQDDQYSIINTKGQLSFDWQDLEIHYPIGEHYCYETTDKEGNRKFGLISINGEIIGDPIFDRLPDIKVPINLPPYKKDFSLSVLKKSLNLTHEPFRDDPYWKRELKRLKHIPVLYTTYKMPDELIILTSLKESFISGKGQKRGKINKDGSHIDIIANEHEAVEVKFSSYVQKLIQKLEEQEEDRYPHPKWIQLAILYSWNQEKDKAFEALAYCKENDLLYIKKEHIIGGYFQQLFDDPRWEPYYNLIINNLNLPDDQSRYVKKVWSICNLHNAYLFPLSISTIDSERKKYKQLSELTQDKVKTLYESFITEYGNPYDRTKMGNTKENKLRKTIKSKYYTNKSFSELEALYAKITHYKSPSSNYTDPREIDEIFNSLVDKLKNFYGEDFAMNSPASDAQIDSLKKVYQQEIPEDFIQLYKLANGQSGTKFSFFSSGNEFMSIEYILNYYGMPNSYQSLHDHKSDFSNLPLAYAFTGDYLVLDYIRNSETIGQVIEEYHDGEPAHRAISIKDYLGYLDTNFDTVYKKQ